MAEFWDVNAFAVDIRADLTMTEVYQEVASVELLGAEAGTYEYGLSGVHSYDQSIYSEYRRVSIDGGDTWQETILEPSDSSNVRSTSFQFYKTGVSGDISLIVQGRKEVVTGVMVVHSINAWIKRVA